MLVLGLCKADDLEAAEESFDWMLKWQPHDGLDLYECFRDKVYWESYQLLHSGCQFRYMCMPEVEA